MTCSEVERVLPDIIDGADDFEFQSHLRVCPVCSELVAELRMIASEAGTLAATEEPPQRVWVGIAAELRAEGLIRDPEPVAARPVAQPARTRRWNPFWLAPVAVAILAAGSYFVNHKTAQPAAQPVAQQAVPAQTQPQQGPANPEVAQQTPAQQTPAQQARIARAPQTSNDGAGLEAELSAPPSGDDEQFLSEVSTRAPGMRTTYENQLKAVNQEIQETQNYIKLHPRDLDARQHLMETYQQKAMLYQMALDRIQ